MNELLSSQTALLALVVGTYLGSRWVYDRVRVAVFHPMIVSLVVVAGYLWLFDIPYDEFMTKVQVIDYMLGLSVVALGYLLYEQLALIRTHAGPILVAVILGSIAGVVSVVWIAQAMGATPEVIASLQPKSITTPIALVVSNASGGIAPLTSIVVILVGVFGGIAAPSILRLLGITHPVATGLSMGSAAHALGTARAVEMGATEGAISGLAIALMGLVTAVLIPILTRIL